MTMLSAWLQEHQGRRTAGELLQAQLEEAGEPWIDLPWIWKMDLDSHSYGAVTEDEVAQWTEEGKLHHPVCSICFSMSALLLLLVVRIEWLHAKASVARWAKEELLLCEESRRILASFVAQQAMWQARAESIEGSSRFQCGQRAFAVSQRAVAEKLVSNAHLHYQEVLHATFKAQ